MSQEEENRPQERIINIHEAGRIYGEEVKILLEDLRFGAAQVLDRDIFPIARQKLPTDNDVEAVRRMLADEGRREINDTELILYACRHTPLVGLELTKYIEFITGKRSFNKLAGTIPYLLPPVDTSLERVPNISYLEHKEQGMIRVIRLNGYKTTERGIGAINDLHEKSKKTNSWSLFPQRKLSQS